MTRYSPLFSAISKLETNHKPAGKLKSPDGFPFPTIYAGQQDILDKATPGNSFCLVPHTGFGKTPVFLYLTRGKPSIVIEPRKFLQKQVSKYYSDFVLYGRSEYHCQHAPFYNGSNSAAMAPCLQKEDCSDTEYAKTCQNANTARCGGKCQVFAAGTEMKIYPCQDCAYIRAQQTAISELSANRTVICNFGNFWNLLKKAELVVIDEADLFFREISAPIKLKYSTPKKNANDTIQSLLQNEVAGLRNAIKTASSPRMKYQAKNLLYSAEFFLKYHDLCFMYQRKDAFFVEVDPRNVSILSEKIFANKQVIIVSATPGAFNYPKHSASIHQRCGIYFAPVGNLTSHSLKQNPYLMSTAAKTIVEIATHMEIVHDADRVVVHCGNLGTHAASLYKILGEQDCTIHESGKLAETIDKYLESGKKYLLVAAAEYGMDADWCKLQFILKFPYPNLDERMRTLERAMGPDFKAYYEGEARTRVIQMAGRNVRGFDDFGVTICLDSKIQEDYVKHPECYPDWYHERVDRRCY